jgi:hypothetical protein
VRVPKSQGIRVERASAAGRSAFYGVRLLGQASETLYLATLLVAVGTSDSAALGISAVLAAKLAAAVLFGVPAGALADRMGSPRGLALGALLRLAAVGLTASVIGQSSFIWAAAFWYSAGSQLFSSAELASVPLVREGTSARAHSLLMALQYAGQGAGAVLTPMLFLLGGPPLMLLAAALTAALALLLACLFAMRTTGLYTRPPCDRQRPFSVGWAWRFFARERHAGYALGLLTFTDLATKAAPVAVPRYLTGVLGLNGQQALAALVVAGAGTGIALLWSVRGFSTLRAAELMRVALFGAVVALISLIGLTAGVGEASESAGLAALASLAESPLAGFAVVLPVALVLGFCLGIAPIAARAVLTDRAPAGQQARVFASQATCSHATVALPLMVAGFSTEYAGAQTTLAAIAVLGLVMLLLLELMRVHQQTIIKAPELAVAEVSGGS